FLDAVVRSTLSIEDCRLVRYTGGYSACERQRAERQALAERSFRRDSERAAHLQRFIDRFRAKASKARQVQSRVKALERLSLAAPLRAASGLDFSFPDAGECPDPLLLAEGLGAGYDTMLLHDIDLAIERGARIGLLGRNGAGKTTLIRTLTGELPPLAGSIQRAASARRRGAWRRQAGGAARAARARVGAVARRSAARPRSEERPPVRTARAAPPARARPLRGSPGGVGDGGAGTPRPRGRRSRAG